MKSFLKKRWHSLPINVMTALLVFTLVAGGAFAYLDTAQTITQTIDSAPEYGSIVADNFVTLDNVVAGEEFSDTSHVVVVEVGTDGVGKYLCLRLIEATVDPYDKYSVTLATGILAGNRPAGSSPFTLNVRKGTVTILEASVQLTHEGTYTLAESILGTAGDDAGEANVRVEITLEDDPVPVP
ncbi:hypothetical protein ES703_14596 [subsurface metagenome]